MKRLVKQDEIEKSDLYRLLNCFDFRGQTYEWLGDSMPHGERYRIIINHDDYDYVSEYSKLGGRVSQRLTSESARELCILLDAQRMLLDIVSELQKKDLPVYEWLARISEDASVVHMLADFNQLTLDICFPSRQKDILADSDKLEAHCMLVQESLQIVAAEMFHRPLENKR